MSPRDETALKIYQDNRKMPRAELSKLLDELFERDLDVIRKCLERKS